jgi:tetratricopeptide (TPR) repeat protein
MRAVSKGSGETLTAAEHTKWPLVFLSVLMSSLSLLSKEQGVTVIGVCVAFDIFLNWNTVLGRLSETKTNIGSLDEQKTNVSDTHSQQMNQKLTRASTGNSTCVSSDKNGSSVAPHVNGISSRTTNTKRSSKSRSDRSSGSAKLQNMVQRIGFLVVCGVLLVWFRMSMNYDSHPVFKPYEMRAAFHPDRSVRILSFSNIHAHNAWLLLSPSGLCCDWSLGTLPLVSSLSDTRNLYSLALYATLLLLLLHTLCSKRDRMAVGMAMALLLLPFLPASGILLQVGFVIAERVLYMPSLGFCLLVAVGARRLTAACPKGLMQLLTAAMVCLVLVTAMKTLSRNEDWSSDLALFTAGVKVNPNNVKLRNNLGMELKSAGRLEEAQHQYLMAMQIDPEYGEVYFNYGNLLSDAGRYEAAAKYFEISVQNPGTHVKSLNNLATMYYRLGRWAESEALYKESLELDGDHATTYNNLASLYGETKRFRESEEMFWKALELNPHYTEAYFNLGTLYIQMERYSDAERNLQHALRLNPNHYGAANNLKVLEYQRSHRHTS